MYNFDEDEDVARINEEAVQQGKEAGTMSFSCPAHLCWSCMDVKKSDRKVWAKKVRKKDFVLQRYFFCS